MWLQRMGPKPLRPASVPVPWPGHWHFSSGSPYFRRPFDADAYAATKRFLAMESLRVPTTPPSTHGIDCRLILGLDRLVTLSLALIRALTPIFTWLSTLNQSTHCVDSLDLCCHAHACPDR